MPDAPLELLPVPEVPLDVPEPDVPLDPLVVPVAPGVPVPEELVPEAAEELGVELEPLVPELLGVESVDEPLVEPGADPELDLPFLSAPLRRPLSVLSLFLSLS